MENKKKIIIGMSLLVAAIFIVGVSYALWNFNISQTGVNTITSGCIKLELTN